jgi:amino acid transporter
LTWISGPGPGNAPVQPPPQLRRRLSWTLITLYGLGTTIGAGIYVLIGAVVAESGALAPLSFLLASLVAGLSAGSFAELSARMPRAAGEAVYVHEAFRLSGLSLVVGLLVATVGVISSAAIANGLIGYVRELMPASRELTIAVLVVSLTALAIWGIAESVTAAALLTVLEIGGLLLVIGGGLLAGPHEPIEFGRLLPGAESAAWAGIATGAVLAFYAFLGFEDMVNVAEEVRDVERTLPRAILVTLAITTLLYVALAFIAVAIVPMETVTASGAPLAALFKATTGASPIVIVLIGIVAVVNGALIQTIMASRVLYGLSAQGWLPRPLSRVNAATGTPIIATVVTGTILLCLALWLPLVTLAKLSSVITLAVFAVVNLALVRIKCRPGSITPAFTVPLWIPVAGAASAILLIGYQLYAGTF